MEASGVEGVDAGRDDCGGDDGVDGPAGARRWPRAGRGCGEALDARGRTGIQAWLDANPQGRHGRHEYRLEDYGISKQQVERVFGGYMQRYQLDWE